MGSRQSTLAKQSTLTSASTGAAAATVAAGTTALESIDLTAVSSAASKLVEFSADFAAAVCLKAVSSASVAAVLVISKFKATASRRRAVTAVTVVFTCSGATPYTAAIPLLKRVLVAASGSVDICIVTSDLTSLAGVSG